MGEPWKRPGRPVHTSSVVGRRCHRVWAMLRVCRRMHVPAEFITDLNPGQTARHKATPELRDHHVAHPVGPTFESADVSAVFLNRTENIRSIRARVATVTGPADDSEAKEIKDLADHLKNRVWLERFVPLEERLVAAEIAREASLSRVAVKWTPGSKSNNRVILTVNPAG